MSADPNAVGQFDIGAETPDESEPPSDASWRSLLQKSNKKSRNIRGSNYIQLATVDPVTLTPRNRCCVFRGFVDLPSQHVLTHKLDNMSCLMLMNTDARSEKVQQAKSGGAEMVWWFPKTSEQYRLRGPLIFVGNGTYEYDNDEFLQKIRTQQWEKLSDPSRESFLRPVVPGQAVNKDWDVQAGGRDDEGNILPPPDVFLLMLLKPMNVDYLNLKSLFRQADTFKDGTWTREELNY